MSASTGFIGLGLMGSPMAANLIAAGFDVLLYNRTAARAAPLVTAGAALAATPLEVGRGAEIVFLMLTGPEAINGMLWGQEGLCGSGSRCRIVVNMSTVPPAFNRELADRLRDGGVSLVEAPVSGSTDAASSGTLVLLTAGEADLLADLSPYLLAMAKKLVYCGEVGRATSMKMVINMLLGTMLSGLAEAVSLGEKCGFSAAQVLDTVLAGPLACGFFQAKAELIRAGEYPAGFPIKHMVKDLDFIQGTAVEAGAHVPLAGAVRELFSQALDAGLGEQDFAAIKKIFEG